MKSLKREDWIKFLEQLRDSIESPFMVLSKTIRFYREHVDRDVNLNLPTLQEKVFAYKFDDRFGWIRFYIINGVTIEFKWISSIEMVKIFFDHLARTEF